MRLNVLAMAMLALASGCSAQIYTGAALEATTTSKPEVEVAAAPEVPAESPSANDNDVITQTVYGFLDFTTTIGNTVMVFSPQSAPPEGGEQPAKSSATIETKPATSEEPAKLDIQPSKTHRSVETKKDSKIVVSSVIERKADESGKSTRIEVATKSPLASTVVEVRPKDETPGVKNNLAEPEYDFLSKQPAEVVDESYKVINLRASGKSLGGKPRASPRASKDNPTGLVTRLGGTIVKDGLTTVHETSVIGTYINGKYAQVLQSSSRVLDPPNVNGLDSANKIRPSQSQRILKTIGPHQKIKHQQPSLEPTAPLGDEHATVELPGRPGRRHPNNPARSKFRNKIPPTDDSELNNEPAPPRKNRPAGSRPGYKNRSQSSGSTTTTESSSVGVTRRRAGFRPSGSNSSPNKQYKSAKTENSSPLASNPSVKSKLPRTQGRWSYKTTPKPRIAIRKQAGDEEPKAAAGAEPAPSVNPAPSSAEDSAQQQPPPSAQRKEGEYEGELDESESEDAAVVKVSPQQNDATAAAAAEKILPLETLNVEISTPADFNDVYFEIATIKSPYSFQVGTSRNTRYVTVTSTLKKSFATAEPSAASSPSEPLTENILANTGAAYESSLPLDSSVATLPAISLEASVATPPLETITETFSTTQTLLKTHLLPVIANGNSTTRLTLVQTYNIARIVTATKTLPPPEIYQFVPSKTLNEFNSRLDEAGSELHLELDFGEDEADDDDVPKRVLAPSADLDSDLLDVFKSAAPSGKAKAEQSTAALPAKQPAEPPVSPEQAQQLALLKLLGQNGPQVITTSKPVVSLETVYDSHVIPLINNGHTIFSTLSRAIATVPRTSYEYGTSTIAPLLPPQVPQVPQVPLFPPVQPQLTVTSLPFVQQTVATLSDSKVLKLTFGAKTAYTTLYSTRLVPTETTTYVTSTIALQPNVPAYPGYFPPPVGFPGYPFVG